jgi:hypothetical protein
MNTYKLLFIVLVLLGASIFAVSLGASAAPEMALPTPHPCPTCWHPTLKTSWQWQLSDLPVDTSLNVKMYDIDLFDNPKSKVATLHARGIKVVCYMSAGSWEDWRPDAYKFPNSVKGKTLSGWPDEKWLDIRQISILAPIMRARMDTCKAKGFDGIEFDNVDGYTNNSGFPLTYQDQLKYNIFLANAAHARGLSAALKNDNGQIYALAPYFDYALNEQCFQYSECQNGKNSLVTNFINKGKAVFQVEYQLATSQFCYKANSLNFNSMKKNLNLDKWRKPCR